jgi:hypothetical protein
MLTRVIKVICSCDISIPSVRISHDINLDDRSSASTLKTTGYVLDTPLRIFLQKLFTNLSTLFFLTIFFKGGYCNSRCLPTSFVDRVIKGLSVTALKLSFCTSLLLSDREYRCYQTGGV